MREHFTLEATSLLQASNQSVHHATSNRNRMCLDLSINTNDLRFLEWFAAAKDHAFACCILPCKDLEAYTAHDVEASASRRVLVAICSHKRVSHLKTKMPPFCLVSELHISLELSSPRVLLLVPLST